MFQGELLVATNSSLDVIHNEFGETWKVEEADWLFSDDIAVLIKDDITAGSPFTPIYTLEFDDDNLRQQAEEVFLLFQYWPTKKDNSILQDISVLQ